MGRGRAGRRSVGSLGFWLVVGFVGILGLATRLCTTESGQAFLVRYGLTRYFLPQLATRLDVTLARRFIDMGLLRGDLRAREVNEAGRRLREYTFAAPGHLTPSQCNLEITRTARAAGAQVVRAEEHHERGGEVVVWLGFGRTATHRLVIRPPAAPPAAAGKRAGPRLALIVDDLGNGMNDTTRGILDLGMPLTLAILPELSKSRAFFEVARERGIPTLLHLPMEPEGGADPGKGAVRTGMSAEEIDALVGKDHERYPSFVGVNNHMGSRATADLPTMRALAQTLKKRDLVFVDSETTPRTVGRRACREAGVWILRNDLFLDDGGQTTEKVAANLLRLAGMARRRGLAVGIGHPHPATLAALRAMLPRLSAEGIQFVSIDDLRPRPQVAAQAGTEAR